MMVTSMPRGSRNDLDVATVLESGRIRRGQEVVLKRVECMIGIISDGCAGKLNQVEPIGAKESICKKRKKSSVFLLEQD